jgi:hypothetical protein
VQSSANRLRKILAALEASSGLPKTRISCCFSQVLKYETTLDVSSQRTLKAPPLLLVIVKE